MKTRCNKWLGVLAAVAVILLTAANSFGDPVLRTLLRVDSLSCGSCLTTISNQLQTLPGAIGMDADLDKHLVLVDHQPGLTADEIAAAISRIGYPATVLSSAEIPVEQIGRAGATGGQQGAGGSCCGSNQATRRAWAPARGKVLTSVYKIDSLSCTSCLDTIGGELQNMAGTIAIDADFATHLVYVDHQAELSADTVGEGITAAGYPARLLGTGRKVAAASSGSIQGQAAGPSGCNSRGCGATASAWQQLYHRYFEK